MRLIPRDEGFFDLFDALAERLSKSGELLSTLFAEPHRLDQYVTAIKSVEHEADTITHEITARLNRSFVTPLDREDIFALAQHLDDVIDLIDGVARRAHMFHLTESRAAAQALAATLARATQTLQASVVAIKQPREVAERSRAVKQLEEEGDAIYQQAVGELFAGTPEPLEVIKWKEIYDTIERALDQCQAVANVLESVSIKNS